MDKSLVDKTKKVIESVSKMESIRPYILVGGTALSLQIANRLSEDLDFMRWQQYHGRNSSPGRKGGVHTMVKEWI